MDYGECAWSFCGKNSSFSGAKRWEATFCISCISRDAPQRVGHAHPASSYVFRKRLCKGFYVLEQLLGLEERPFEGHLNFRFEVEDAESFRGLM